ncbi:MAG: metallophosphoesterase [Myxococcales bacterium]|nr:metallophosphoesterase [Myxococcales bacterium]
MDQGNAILGSQRRLAGRGAPRRATRARTAGLRLALAAFLVATTSQCAPTRSASAGGSGLAPVTRGTCSEHPAAYVLDPEDPQLERSSLAYRLAAAGFAVEPLPLDSSPSGLHGVLVMRSGAASHPAYATYMERFRTHLYHFVDRANVLVQLAQSPTDEPSPRFLPSTHAAQRDRAPVSALHLVEDEHPLLGGRESGALALPSAGVPNAFGHQAGFQVLMAEERDARRSLLLEGAYGQGRILLSALPLDDAHEGALGELSDDFFAALRTHTRDVCERRTRALIPTFSGMERRFTEGSEMIAVMPDTQVYAVRYPGLFVAQTAWLAQNAEPLNIRVALHLGDIVNNNTPMEWQRARSAMGLLDGVLPYVMVPGNHDYGPSGDASTRETYFNDYFEYEDRSAEPTFGGAFEPGKLDNTYHLVNAWGRRFIIVALEWGPRDEVLAWADHVMGQHPDHLGILVTHAFLNNNDRRFDHTDLLHSQSYNPHQYSTAGGVNDGEEIWQRLIRRHRFVMTLNGHVLGDGTGYLVSETDAGTRCHQMLVNWQMAQQGGEANLRLLELLPDGETVRVHGYSALHDRFLFAPDQSFEFRVTER